MGVHADQLEEHELQRQLQVSEEVSPFNPRLNIIPTAIVCRNPSIQRQSRV